MLDSIEQKDPKPRSKKLKQIAIVAIILIVSLGLAYFMISYRPQPKPKEITPTVALPVDIMEVSLKRQLISIYSQGNVEAQREIDLVSEVAGKIIKASPDFDVGGRFTANEVLLRVDPDHYNIALVLAQARVFDAQQSLAIVQGQARQAKQEWRELGNKEANALFLKQPQLKSAKAQVRAAQAERKRAELNLSNTKIRLPYSGIVRDTYVDWGQYVTVGARLATVYADDIFQVRLPLTDRQLTLIAAAQKDRDLNIPVTLKGSPGGGSRQWQAFIKHFDPVVEANSRLIYAIAEIELAQQQEPLFVGQFVTAKIQGKAFDNLFRIPIQTLRPRNQVWTVDEDNRLSIITPEILSIDTQWVYFRWHKASKLKLVTSALALATQGALLAPKGAKGE